VPGSFRLRGVCNLQAVVDEPGGDGVRRVLLVEVYESVGCLPSDVIADLTAEPAISDRR
jgi:hypothetical protein